jgi:hypothetical protein
MVYETFSSAAQRHTSAMSTEGYSSICNSMGMMMAKEVLVVVFVTVWE